MTFHGGKLRILYYDLREDVSRVFGPYIDELPILTGPIPRIRHTMDVFVAQAAPGQRADVHHRARLRVRQRLPAGIDGRAAAAVQSRRTCRCSGRARCRSWATTSTSRRRPPFVLNDERHVVVQHRCERQRRLARGLDRQPRRAAAGRRQLGRLHAGHVAGGREPEPLRSDPAGARVRTRPGRDAQPEHLHGARHRRPVRLGAGQQQAVQRLSARLRHRRRERVARCRASTGCSSRTSRPAGRRRSCSSDRR